MVLNIYIAIFCFFLGIIAGFVTQWLYNHHRGIYKLVVLIMYAFLIFIVTYSFLTPDTVLRQTYSELQVWVDFASGFFGAMLGYWLEDRYERKPVVVD